MTADNINWKEVGLKAAEGANKMQRELVGLDKEVEVKPLDTQKIKDIVFTYEDGKWMANVDGVKMTRDEFWQKCGVDTEKWFGCEYCDRYDCRCNEPKSDNIRTELLKLLDDPRTGLKDSSDTNKTRYAILELFTRQEEKIRKDERKKLIQEIDIISAHLYEDHWTRLKQNIK